MVRSSDGDTPFFDITIVYTGVLGDKLAPFICIICLHYILNKSVDRNLHPGFTLTKEKAIDTLMYEQYIPYRLVMYECDITNIYFADDIAVITNSLIYANILLHKFEDTAKYIGLHINSDKTEYMCLITNTR